MKCSDAILLGDSLKRASAGDYLRYDSRWERDPTLLCGCALGGAVLAVSGVGEIIPDIFWTELRKRFPWVLDDVRPEHKALIPCSSGLLDGYEIQISYLYYEVYDKEKTLEELVDWVRSVEPACGECNRFNCSCVKQVVETEIKEGICA